MLSVIKERDDVEQPKPIVLRSTLIFGGGGGKNLAALNRKKQLQTTPITTTTTTTTTTTELAAQVEGNDYENANREKVLSMSASEINEAVNDLSMVLSAKSIEFLRKRGHKKLEVECLLLSPLLSSSSTTLSSSLPPPPPPPPSSSSSSSSSSPPMLPSYIASNAEELKIAQSSASKEITANIAWALDNDESVERNNNGTEEKKKDDSAIRRALSRSSHDRFDLNGSKVINGREEMIETLIKSALEQTGLSQDSLNKLATSIVDGMLAVKFCVLPNAPDSQPQDELLQHESEASLAGYSYLEICEFFRSQAPHQKSLALRMLTGVLRKREEVVSSEAYGGDNGDISCAAATALAEGAASLSKLFRSTLSRLYDLFLLLLSSEGLIGLEQRSHIDVRRVFTFSLTFLCAADLPASLPTLLLWNMQQRLNLSNKLGFHTPKHDGEHDGHDDRHQHVKLRIDYVAYDVPNCISKHIQHEENGEQNRLAARIIVQDIKREPETDSRKKYAQDICD